MKKSKILNLLLIAILLTGCNNDISSVYNPSSTSDVTSTEVTSGDDETSSGTTTTTNTSTANSSTSSGDSNQEIDDSSPLKQIFQTEFKVNNVTAPEDLCNDRGEWIQYGTEENIIKINSRDFRVKNIINKPIANDIVGSNDGYAVRMHGRGYIINVEPFDQVRRVELRAKIHDINHNLAKFFLSYSTDNVNYINEERINLLQTAEYKTYTYDMAARNVYLQFFVEYRTINIDYIKVFR